MVATIRNQYVAKFQMAARARVAICNVVIERIAAQTADRLVNCGRKYQNTAKIRPSEITIGRTRRNRNRRRSVGADLTVSGGTAVPLMSAVPAVLRGDARSSERASGCR